MNARFRVRTIQVNSYLGLLVVTLVGSFAALYLVHLASGTPFRTFASVSAYEIGESW